MAGISDRDLVLGVLAVQLGFVRREAIVRAARMHREQPERGLGELLVQLQVLSARRLQLLQPVVEEHLVCDGARGPLSVESHQARAIVREAFETQRHDGAAQETVDADSDRPNRDVEDTGDPDRTTAPDVKRRRAGQSPRVADPNAGDRYVIQRLHAEGGLGTVYLAEDRQFGRPVALKEMQERHHNSESLQSRFLQEAKINARLQHPGIVPVFSLDRFADGRPFYAMRFVEGDSFDRAIRQFHESANALSSGERTLQLRKLLSHFVDLCHAIAYAHSQQIIHRDLKPSNVMLGKFGETLLIDWGLAKSVTDGTDPSKGRSRSCS